MCVILKTIVCKSFSLVSISPPTFKFFFAPALKLIPPIQAISSSHIAFFGSDLPW